jgi:catechol 2,3-dioxygenase-like lactoylglutathione lyase family enzyme
MAAVVTLPSTPISGFNLNNLQWVHIEGGPEFDYPINYWLAILGARPEVGGLDFLVKWEPDSYCHFHRHLGETTTLILEGEHHVVETTANQTLHKIRQPGHYSRTPDGEAHMEYAGPAGSLVFFSMRSPDGRLFEILDKDENVLGIATVEGLLTGKLTS